MGLVATAVPQVTVSAGSLDWVERLLSASATGLPPALVPEAARLFASSLAPSTLAQYIRHV